MKNSNNFTCRLIKPLEAHHVYDLISRIFQKYVAPTYSKEGVNTFLNMLSIEFLKLSTPEQFTIIAEKNNTIIGILSIINKNHIALLFVETEFQKNGIGKALIHDCINRCMENNADIKSLTVSSSPNSLSFYKNISFKVIEEEKNENGMRFTPMEMLIIQ
jgi:GNAT superfamily N-acetyltransferase